MIHDANKQLAAMFNGAGITGIVNEDAMPVVRIEMDLNVTARKLGEIVARLDLYNMSGEQVFFDHEGERQVMTGRKFRTWISEFVIMALNFDKKTGDAIPVSLGVDEAATLLEAENFRRGVRPLKGINHVRCPVIREDGRLDLLPWGYDAQTQIYTVSGGLDFATDLDVAAAKGRFLRMFGSFPLTDERSQAVQVAAMMALFIRHLPGGMGLRPGFLWYANKPGSGKSVLAKAALYPVMGRAAVAKLKKDDDLDKEIEAFCRAAVPYIFLDNIRGGLNSTTIEQMLTSEESTGRAMGGHGVFNASNTALLLATGNQLDLTDDALRRFLLIDLFEKGDPEERVIETPLNDSLMRSEAWRIAMLEAMWALVAHWHEAGMPRGSLSLASFEEYAALMGGIVEAAGYVPPFTKAVLPDAKSPGQAEFYDLMALVLDEMGLETAREFKLPDLCRLARAGQLYQNDVGTEEDGKKLTFKMDGLAKEMRSLCEDRGYMDKSQESAFGKRITKEIGTEPVVRGKRIEFGKRKQARRATFTVRVLG